MSDDQDEAGAPPNDHAETAKRPASPPKARKTDREARLAEALRRNLRRRKASGPDIEDGKED